MPKTPKPALHCFRSNTKTLQLLAYNDVFGTRKLPGMKYWHKNNATEKFYLLFSLVMWHLIGWD